MFVILAVGAGIGFPIGRWYADMTRARSAMKKTWDDRSKYRQGDNK